MCQSKIDGGRRCGIGNALKAKISKRDYLTKTEREIPEKLDVEIAELHVKHEEYNQFRAEKAARVAERKQLEAERAERRKAREERKQKEAVSKEKKSRPAKEKASRATQLYLTRKEQKELMNVALESLVKEKESDGTLNDFLNTAAKRNAEKNSRTYIPYEEWNESNEGGPAGYLRANGLTIQTAGRLTHERVYDGIRERIEGKVPLSQKGDASISGEYKLEKPQRSICGRVQSTYGTADNSTRSEKTDILLTHEGSERIDRIAHIFGIKRSDAMRNQALGIDHRLQQYHQSAKAYELRKEVIAEYEKEDGLYRKKGESLESLYERLISDEGIILR